MATEKGEICGVNKTQTSEKQLFKLYMVNMMF